MQILLLVGSSFIIQHSIFIIRIVNNTKYYTRYYTTLIINIFKIFQIDNITENILILLPSIITFEN